MVAGVYGRRIILDGLKAVLQKGMHRDSGGAADIRKSSCGEKVFLYPGSQSEGTGKSGGSLMLIRLDGRWHPLPREGTD